jgi:hypothetical protein
MFNLPPRRIGKYRPLPGHDPVRAFHGPDGPASCGCGWTDSHQEWTDHLCDEVTAR